VLDLKVEKSSFELKLHTSKLSLNFKLQLQTPKLENSNFNLKLELPK